MVCSEIFYTIQKLILTFIYLHEIYVDFLSQGHMAYSEGNFLYILFRNLIDLHVISLVKDTVEMVMAIGVTPDHFSLTKIQKAKSSLGTHVDISYKVVWLVVFILFMIMIMIMIMIMM